MSLKRNTRSTAARNALALGGLLLFALLVPAGLLLPGCGSDENPVEPTDSSADVDRYMANLPDWETLSPPVASSDAPTGDTTYDPAEMIGGVQYVCKTTPCSITETPEKIVTYDPSAGALWLGSLIQGKSYAGGVGTIQEVPIRQRAPITIVIDNLAFSDNNRTVPNPDGGKVMDAIQQMVVTAEAEGLTPSSEIFYNKTEAHSSEQALLKVGMSARYMGVSARANFAYERSSEKRTLAAKFIHNMFTTSIVLPQRPSDMFSGEFTEALLQEQVSLGSVGPDNLPVYVGQITWGRMLVFTITSTYSQERIEAALKATYDNITGGVAVDAEAKKVLEDSRTEFTAVALGGDQGSVLSLIRDGNLREYFQNEAKLTTAVPLSYTLLNLADNDPAKVSETFAYDMMECGPGPQCFKSEAEWEAALAELEAGWGTQVTTEKLNTTIENIYLATEIDPGSLVWWEGQTNIGQVLTFPASSTGLPIDFRFSIPDALGITYNDQEGPQGQRLLSPGDIDNGEDDDFAIEAWSSTCEGTVLGIGITVFNNEWIEGETLKIYDATGTLVAYFDEEADLPDANNYVFMGVVSAIPIYKIEFDENPGKDDIAVRDFRFGVKACPNPPGD